MPDIDFKAIGQQAVDMVVQDTGANTPVQSGTTTTTVSPVVSSTTVSPSTPTTGQVQPVATPTHAEQTIPVDFGNGRVEQLTQAQIVQKLKEAEQGGLRQADYTRKTQEVARQNQEIEQAKQYLLQQAQMLQQQQAHAQAILNNPQLALQLAQQQQLANQPVDPNQPMTIGQAQQMAEVIAGQFQQIKQFQQGSTALIDKRANEIVQEQMQIANYAESINGVLNQVYQENPILKTIPEIEDVIRYRVAQLQPQDLEEANAAFKQISKEMADNLQATFNAANQQQQIQRQQLAQQGIAAPGGAAVQPAQPNFKNEKGGLDWNKLKNAAISLAS